MPTTFHDLVPIRRTASGVSSSAQGADGVDELTRTAIAALLASAWTEDAAAPFFPVHDYAQGLPRGDAWKACYGYDAAARTERAACGAVCYTIKKPSDQQTQSHVSSVSFKVSGDRYLDAGVDVHVVLSWTATPPTVAELAARTPDATVCATSSQAEPPNRRTGVSQGVTITPASSAAPYIHVALLLHDYLGARGAWIEGGAMLEGGAASIVLDRDVSADPAPTARALLITSAYDAAPDYANVPHAYALGSFYYWTFSPTAFAGKDILATVDLAYRGLLPSRTMQRGFSVDTNVVRGAATVGAASGEAWYLNVLCHSVAYYTPPGLAAGMSAPLAIVNTGDAGFLRAAIVQCGTVANVGDSYADVTASEMPALDQIAAGAGPDIVGILQTSFSANETKTVSIPILAEPAKPFLYLCIFPLTSGVDAYGSNPGILVAT